MGRFARMLSRRLGPVTEPKNKTVERLQLLEAVVEDVKTCYRNGVADGMVDVAVLVADLRAKVNAPWRELITAETYRKTVGRGLTPTVLIPLARQRLAAHLGATMPQLAKPAPEGRFWVAAVTATGASLAAVEVA